MSLSIGILGGLGRTATLRYTTMLKHLGVQMIVAEAETEPIVKSILKGRLGDLPQLLKPAAKILRRRGCTHVALACVSCQKVGNQVITECGMQPIPMRAQLQYKLNTTYTVFAHSLAVRNLIARTPFSVQAPSAEVQAKIDDLIMGAGGLALDRQSQHPYRNELDGIMQMTMPLLGCTDLSLPVGAPESSVDISRNHCLTIARLFMGQPEFQ